MDLSSNSRYLYVTDNGRQMLHAFSVGQDGTTLTPIDAEDGLPSGVQGVAAR
jgi:6-phosphogluconolactonase (cycloisomerase 2 family)